MRRSPIDLPGLARRLRGPATFALLLAARPAVAQEIPPWNWSDQVVLSAVNQVRAGRDLNPTEWPGGARVAVLLSFDVDNETVFGLRDGEVEIGPLSEGQYGARVALPRVLELLDAEDVPASFFFPAWSLKIAPEQAEWIQAAEEEHEIAVHGWIHERNAELDEPTERRLLEEAVAALTEITGRRPMGYRAPSWNLSPNTLGIVRDMGFLYESSLMADDRPYEILADGEPTGLVELPVSWTLDDAPLLSPLGDRYANPRDVMQVWIDDFDRAWEEGTMFLLTMHPHRIGHRSRIVALEGLIEHIRARGDVWFGTHEAAARWVRARAGME
ncbi:MAG: polysaccharide deacetylase [Gemmatimonadota bacterium]|jgi:peptidoglycan/xylan/chitin deacetylase (PgdA/CDA1 family)